MPIIYQESAVSEVLLFCRFRSSEPSRLTCVACVGLIGYSVFKTFVSTASTSRLVLVIGALTRVLHVCGVRDDSTKPEHMPEAPNWSLGLGSEKPSTPTLTRIHSPSRNPSSKLKK
jgi:hypothetical protein